MDLHLYRLTTSKYLLLLQKRFATREVTVKDMASGAEQSLPLDAFLNTLN